MLSAAAAKKEFAVSEAELMAGEEKAMLLAEQAQKSTPPKVGKYTFSELNCSEPSSGDPPVENQYREVHLVAEHCLLT